MEKPTRLRIFAEFMRMSFMGVGLFVFPLLVSGWLQSQSLLFATVVMILFIIILRIIAVVIFPCAALGLQTRRQKAAATYSEIVRTAILSPILAFYYILRLQTRGVGLFAILLEIGLYWFLINIIILELYLYLSMKKGERYYY